MSSSPSDTAERRLALLIDAVDEYAIFMLDPAGHVATWNRGAKRIKGYGAEEIVGRHFSAFYSEDDVVAGKPDRELELALAHGQHRDEGWRVRKDGSRFWANVVITAVVDEDGHLDGFAKVTRDDTDRRRALEQERLVSQLADHERIARQLQETVVRRIVDAGMLLEGTLGAVQDATAVERLEEVVRRLDETVREIRVTAFGLVEPEFPST